MNDDYFVDQFGYIMRWDITPERTKTVVVANWQGENKGSAKECVKLLERLRAAEYECNHLSHIVDEMRGVLNQCRYDYSHHSFSAATRTAIIDVLETRT